MKKYFLTAFLALALAVTGLSAAQAEMEIPSKKQKNPGLAAPPPHAVREAELREQRKVERMLLTNRKFREQVVHDIINNPQNKAVVTDSKAACEALGGNVDSDNELCDPKADSGKTCCYVFDSPL